MPRIARGNGEGKIFHVMVQGIGKEYVFPDDNCKGYYISCLQKAKTKVPIKILGFCVMGNHAHILVTVKTASELGYYFKRANAEYAMYYNRINKRAGYVFRDRFKSEVIGDARYLIKCLAYIHSNPTKAKIVGNAEEYKFSSYTNYVTQGGIVDFSEAKNYYDINLLSIRTMMQELTDTKWLEHDDVAKEDKDLVFQELVERYKTSKEIMRKDNELLRNIVAEMQERTGLSQREIAIVCDIGRETLRNRLAIPPSP